MLLAHRRGRGELPSNALMAKYVALCQPEFTILLCYFWLVTGQALDFFRPQLTLL